MKLYMNKESKKTIEQAMSKTQRKQLASGATFCAIIERTGRPLKRWGDYAYVTFKKNGEIILNSLVNLAWNWDEEKAKVEAANAIDYMVYGEDFNIAIVPFIDEYYKINADEAKKWGLDKNVQHWLVPGTLVAESDDGETVWQERFPFQETRHRGHGEGCFWTPWVNRYGTEVE